MHFSEMNFLFSNYDNRETIIQQLDRTSQYNTYDVIKGTPNYVVYKGNNSGTDAINTFLKEEVYKDNTKNPYIKLLEEFKTNANLPGAGKSMKASDLAYLKDLGRYPMNRMAILRRFPEGGFVPENLEEMYLKPISTVVGWLNDDQSFPEISFNETWGSMDKRFDTLIAEKLNNILKQNKSIIPIADFAQGVLFEFYKKANITGTDNSTIENVDGTTETKSTPWGLNNLPIGDPNVLKEAPWRDPNTQNIKSSLVFDLETTYEQKLLGDVDPGSAMLDIIDNLLSMGTSNMAYYWDENSPNIKDAKTAIEGKSNNLNSWWEFISKLMQNFWETLNKIYTDEKTKFLNGDLPEVKELSLSLLNSLLTSTISIHRFELRGSIELMVGGTYSTTPWHLTLGNPYSPWISTNHIIIRSATIETSKEMGFNDQPQWLKVKFTCEFSRNLGQQEIMRMFNNTYKRTYNTPPASSSSKSVEETNNNLDQHNGITPLTSISQTPLVGIEPTGKLAGISGNKLISKKIGSGENQASDNQTFSEDEMAAIRARIIAKKSPF